MVGSIKMHAQLDVERMLEERHRWTPPEMLASAPDMENKNEPFLSAHNQSEGSVVDKHISKKMERLGLGTNEHAESQMWLHGINKHVVINDFDLKSNSLKSSTNSVKEHDHKACVTEIAADNGGPHVRSTSMDSTNKDNAKQPNEDGAVVKESPSATTGKRDEIAKDIKARRSKTNQNPSKKKSDQMEKHGRKDNRGRVSTKMKRLSLATNDHLESQLWLHGLNGTNAANDSDLNERKDKQDSHERRERKSRESGSKKKRSQESSKINRQKNKLSDSNGDLRSKLASILQCGTDDVDVTRANKKHSRRAHNEKNDEKNMQRSIETPKDLPAEIVFPCVDDPIEFLRNEIPDRIEISRGEGQSKPSRRRSSGDSLMIRDPLAHSRHSRSHDPVTNERLSAVVQQALAANDYEQDEVESVSLLLSDGNLEANRKFQRQSVHRENSARSLQESLGSRHDKLSANWKKRIRNSFNNPYQKC